MLLVIEQVTTAPGELNSQIHSQKIIKQKSGNTFIDFELSIKDNGAKYR